MEQVLSDVKMFVLHQGYLTIIKHFIFKCLSRHARPLYKGRIKPVQSSGWKNNIKCTQRINIRINQDVLFEEVDFELGFEMKEGIIFLKMHYS